MSRIKPYEQLDVERKLLWLANYIECKAADLIPELLAESRCEAATRIMHDFAELIEELRKQAGQY